MGPLIIDVSRTPIDFLCADGHKWLLGAPGLAYLWAAPTTLGRRLLHLLGAAGGIAVVAGSYIALFQLTPASARPYMAGSKTNSFLELTFGYNGLGRITGSGEGMPGGGPGGGLNAGFGGTAGITRIFGSSFGGEVSWLLPAALILLVAGLWFTRREARTSTTRAALLLWGGWLIITAGIFSFMSGIVHPYYAVALAPAIAALVGIGSVKLWRGRSLWPARIVLAVTVLATSTWSAVLLGRDPDWMPGLRMIIVILGVLAAAALLLSVDRMGALPAKLRKAATSGVLVLSLLAGGLGTTAWTLATAAQPHSGPVPTSGPTASGMGGGMGGAGMGPGYDGNTDGPAADTRDAARTAPGGPGAGTPSAELIALLKSSGTKWSAIVSGATSAADLELATDTSVIALGGFVGSDPYPTLAQFQEMVNRGEIGNYIAGGMGGGPGGNSEVATWVAANYTAETVGNTTVYKLAP